MPELNLAQAFFVVVVALFPPLIYLDASRGVRIPLVIVESQ